MEEAEDKKKKKKTDCGRRREISDCRYYYLELFNNENNLFHLFLMLPNMEPELI